MPTSWSDDFTTDNFSGGVAYSTIVGTEGSSFNVAPHDLSVPAGGIVFWQDQRTNFQSSAGSVTLESTITVLTTYVGSFPYLNACGFSDPTTHQWFILGGIYQGQFGYVLTDATVGGVFSGNIVNTIPYTPPTAPYTIAFSITTSGTITVTDGTNTVTGSAPAGFLADAALVSDGGVFPMGALYGSDASFSPLASNDSKWTYGPQVIGPFVSSLDPYLGFVAGGQAITIHGSGFTGVTNVQINSVSIPFVFNSDTSISVTSPAGAAGTTVPVSVTTPVGTSVSNPNDLFKYVDFIPTWDDVFAIDYFAMHDYTVLDGVEGSTFTVNPSDLRFNFDTGLTWEDQRTYQLLPFESTITIAGGAYPSLAFGLADGSLTAVLLLALLTGGNMSIKTANAIDGTHTAGTTVYVADPINPYTLSLKANAATISVYDTTMLITSIATPPNLATAMMSNVVTPVVIGLN